jgi:D-alanine-D-alanine ligase
MGGSKGAASKGMQSTRRQIPADLPAETTAEIQRLACETFRVLSCEGVSRIDFIIDGANGEVYVNEINEIPGSLSFYLWEATGVSFAELTDRLIKQALRRKREQSLKTVSYDQNIFSLGGGIKGGVKK